MREFVNITFNNNACARTKERLSRFKQCPRRFELIRRQKNTALIGDGFYIGEPMTMFGLDTYKEGLWARAWEGWLPDDEFSFIEETEEDNEQ